MMQALNSLIGTLDNDAQRSAFVAQLKALRDSTQNAAPPSPTAASTDILGAIASGIASVETKLGGDSTPLRVWSGRSREAASEWQAVLTGAKGQSFARVLAGLFGTLAG
ncbi:hypothetical protein [Caballeronia grimmiae]|uniref:hypothetical protein n=1 Tax=Caballeronia grimmiae TaxID=1071679 RepID=UPI0038BB2D47